jgi:hypothetical protein
MNLLIYLSTPVHRKIRMGRLKSAGHIIDDIPKEQLTNLLQLDFLKFYKTNIQP